MGRWSLDGWQIAVGPDIRILPGERASAEMLIVTHNADCAAYEERITVLECRLARIVAMLEPGSGRLGHVEDEDTLSLTIAEWNILEQAFNRAVAIAEGREDLPTEAHGEAPKKDGTQRR